MAAPQMQAGPLTKAAKGKDAAVALAGSVITREQIKNIVAVFESVAEKFIAQSLGYYGTLIFSFVEKAVFNDANIDAVCNLLGIE